MDIRAIVLLLILVTSPPIYSQEDTSKSDSLVGKQILQEYVDSLPDGQFKATFTLDNSQSPASFSFMTATPDQQTKTDLDIHFFTRQGLRLDWKSGKSTYVLSAKSKGEILWLMTPVTAHESKPEVAKGLVLSQRLGSLSGMREWRLFWPDWVVFMTGEGADFYNFGKLEKSGDHFVLPYFLGEKPGPQTLNGRIEFSNNNGFQILEIFQEDGCDKTTWKFENEATNGVYLPVLSTVEGAIPHQGKRANSFVTLTKKSGYTFDPSMVKDDFEFPSGVAISDSLRNTKYLSGGGSLPAKQIDQAALKIQQDSSAIAPQNESSTRWSVAFISFLAICAALILGTVLFRNSTFFKKS